MAAESYQIGSTGPSVAPAPPVETLAPPPSEPPPVQTGQVETDPNALRRRLLVMVLILLFAIGGGVIVGRALKNKSSPRTRPPSSSGESSLPEAKGKLVGLYLRNGTAYFGTLVFEDDKTFVLRDVYLPLGFFPRREGGEPVLQVAKFNETSPDAPAERVVPKKEVLFSSEKVNPEIVRAIERYVPPTPTPAPVSSPVSTPTSSQSAFGI
jgi:hypothetical protein